MIRTTSKEAYRALIETGELSDQQQKVLQAVVDNPRLSDRDIVELTGLDINAVCGRRNELMQLGYIKEAGKRINKNTNRNAILWEFAITNPKQAEPKKCLTYAELGRLTALLRKANKHQLDNILREAQALKGFWWRLIKTYL